MTLIMTILHAPLSGSPTSGGISRDDNSIVICRPRRPHTTLHQFSSHYTRICVIILSLWLLTNGFQMSEHKCYILIQHFALKRGRVKLVLINIFEPEAILSFSIPFLRSLCYLMEHFQRRSDSYILFNDHSV